MLILSDSAAEEAMRELLENEKMMLGTHAFLPAPLFEQVVEAGKNVRSVADFQAKIAVPVLKAIEKASISSLTTSGLEQLERSKKYLFISNHRDIVLDSAYLNVSLFEHGFETTQVATGDNLMKWRSSELIFRLNKSIVVRRSGSPMELYRSSIALSKHISTAVAGQKSSVWIAQREGRSKDGDDRTASGVLKMLSLSAGGKEADLGTFFRSLRIVPVSISYEFNPCDHLFAQEFLAKRADPDFKKSFDEDLKNMLLGLGGEKGRVHFHFGEPLDAELDFFENEPNPKRQIEGLADLIDQKIHQNYRLHEVNQAAFSLLENEDEKGVSPELLTFFESKKAKIKDDVDGAGWRYLLGIYANPLVNQRHVLAS